jgi:predicted GIY-YIG superfamily endonuclease
MAAWVYILRCSGGTYYTGCTTNIDQRLYEHQAGIYPGYTSCRRPVKLVWIEEFSNVNQAIDVERQLKGWSRRKKEALMKGDFILIHELAQSKEMKERRNKRPPG